MDTNNYSLVRLPSQNLEEIFAQLPVHDSDEIIWHVGAHGRIALRVVNKSFSTAVQGFIERIHKILAMEIEEIPGTHKGVEQFLRKCSYLPKNTPTAINTSEVLEFFMKRRTQITKEARFGYLRGKVYIEKATALALKGPDLGKAFLEERVKQLEMREDNFEIAKTRLLLHDIAKNSGDVIASDKHQQTICQLCVLEAKEGNPASICHFYDKFELNKSLDTLLEQHLATIKGNNRVQKADTAKWILSIFNSPTPLPRVLILTIGFLS